MVYTSEMKEFQIFMYLKLVKSISLKTNTFFKKRFANFLKIIIFHTSKTKNKINGEKMIRKIKIVEVPEHQPYLKKFVGMEIPLQEPFCPNANPRFLWNENTGETLKNLPLSVRKRDLLDVIKNVCHETYRSLIENDDLGNSIVLQTHNCILSK